MSAAGGPTPLPEPSREQGERIASLPPRPWTPPVSAAVSGDDVTGDQAGALDLDAILYDATEGTDLGDRAFIERACKDIVALVAEVRRLREALDDEIAHREEEYDARNARP